MPKSNFQKLTEALRLYKSIPKMIREKSEMLELRLCNPGTTINRGFSAFHNIQDEIEYLERFKKAFERGVKELNNEQKELCLLLLQNKNTFVISSIMGLTVLQIHGKVHFIWEKLSKYLRFTNIYSEEETSETEKEF